MFATAQNSANVRYLADACRRTQHTFAISQTWRRHMGSIPLSALHFECTAAGHSFNLTIQRISANARLARISIAGERGETLTTTYVCGSTVSLASDIDISARQLSDRICLLIPEPLELNELTSLETDIRAWLQTCV